RSLSRELDWVIKLDLIHNYMQRKKVGFEDQRISMLDLQYHDIKRSRGLYYILAREDLVERMVTEAEIDRAVVEPPLSTRARIRSDFIKYAMERNKSYDVGWSYLKLNDRYQRTILCKDPFQSKDPRVEEMIASS
ncbi:MAG: proteasome accessory factor PafA2 family protein, partial [Candidatus Methylomirabilales bacterium]